MAVLCIRSTSIINSPNAISILVDTLPNRNIIRLNDTSSEEIISSRLWKKIILVPKLLRKYSTERIATLFVAAEEAKYRGKSNESKRK
jgi:hypothetical protein